MSVNLWIVLASALAPLLVGFIWYHPKVFGNTWMRAAGITPEMAKGANMALIFGLSILFAFFIAFSMMGIAVQQLQTAAILQTQPGFSEPGSESSEMLKKFMELYGRSYRTFGHGVLHGVLTGLFFIMPVIGTNALFERKGFKYVAINSGYWIVSLALMGGIISKFA
jgi:hypothetical protein